MLRSICKGLWALGALAMATAANAGTYYVATNGLPTNTGTAASPWPSVNYALWKVGGGHTIIVKPGVYTEPIRVQLGHAGTEASPTIIRSEVKWKAIVSGTPETAIATASGTKWVVIDGFEVAGAGGDGVKLSGDNNTVRNCYVHNNARQGISSHGRVGARVERNLIEYNGQSPQYHHGIYVSGNRITILSNVIRHNSGLGINTNGGITNSLIANNLVHDHFGDGAPVTIFAPAGGGRNFVLNNTIVKNRTGLRFYGGNGDIVANNILMTSSDGLPGIQVSGSGVIKADYNLCSPRSPYDGPNSMTGDPQFVAPGKATFWLRANSPVIGKGTTEFLPPTDFWGRPISKTARPALGAFAFSLYLTTDAARQTWYNLWPYRYATQTGMDVPDLWLPPLD